MASARRLLAVAAAVALLSGCGALGSDVGEVTVSTATREPVEALPELNSDDYDLVVERDFTVDSVTRTCRAYVRAEGENGAPELIRASEFLSTYDASTIQPSVDQYGSEELERREAQGVSEHELLIMLVADRITEDLRAAGHLNLTVSIRGDTRSE